MNLRPYVPGDWERLCIIHDAARRDELQASGLAPAFLDLEATADEEGLFDGDVIVAESGSEILGFVAYARGELTWLYVDPGRYRQGTGRQLLRHAVEACGGNISAEVLVGNDPALALYLSEGFKIIRRIDGKLTGNEAFDASGYVLEHTASEA